MTSDRYAIAQQLSHNQLTSSYHHFNYLCIVMHVCVYVYALCVRVYVCIV